MHRYIKRKFMLEFIAFSLLLAIVAGFLGIVGYNMGKSDLAASYSVSAKNKKIIIDAGHGGMDGGATGVNGILEKELNLILAEKSAELFRLNGYEVIMTRDTDISRGEDAPKGKRKMTDLVKRLEIAENNPDAVFLSIHMNKFPQEVCRGLQLWYSGNNDMSRRLSEIIKASVKAYVQQDNSRECKKATSSIYLLDRMKNVSVLAECGFVSNTEECQKLCENSYQNKLASVFFYSVNDFYNNVG